MHKDGSSGIPAPRGRRAGTPWRAALFVMLVVIAAAALLAPAAMAATTYVGGPRAGDFPLYVANDHSVSTLRFEIPAVAEGETPWLLPSTEYYVKIRLSPTPAPAGSANRGFTWNPTTGLWAQERADWVEFPIITSDEDGAYIPGNQWFAFKFADVTKSGTYYILVSLQPVDGGAGTTMNNADPPAVTVVDPAGTIVGATPAFWVHNGIATGASSAKRVDVVPSGGTDIWALSRTEANLVDEDGDGVVDDEDYGPAGATGDFSLAVPSGMDFDVRLQSIVWPLASPSPIPPLQVAVPSDVDIAYANADQTPPARVTGLQAASGDSTVSLEWHAADEADGVTEYRVYRWTDPTPIGDVIAYTAQPLLLATTTDPAYEDADVVNGEDYYYVVRAADAASKRRAALERGRWRTARADDPHHQRRRHDRPLQGHDDADRVPDRRGGGAARRLHGRHPEVDRRGATWTTIGSAESDGGTFVTPALTRATKFRATWAGTDEYAGSTSAYVLVKPKVALQNPVAPTSVKKYVTSSCRARSSRGTHRAGTRRCSSTATRRTRRPASGCSRRRPGARPWTTSPTASTA